MKKALSIAVFVIIILAALPFISGLVAKNRFENLTAELQARNPHVQIQSEYHLGWLSSTATLTWGQRAPESAWPAISHEVIIHHGPITFFHDANGKAHFFIGFAVLDVRLPEIAKGTVFTLNFQKKIFSALIRIPFNLHYAVKVQAALQGTVNLAVKPILSFNLDQLQLDCNFAHDFSRMKGQFLLQNLNLNAGSSGYLSIPNIQVQLDNHREQGVYLGNETITIPSIDLSATPMVQFKLQDFQSAFVGSRAKSDVSYQMNLGIDQVTYSNQNYGPLNFDFQINNLNFKVLAQIEEKIQTYAKNRTAQPENTEALQNALVEDLKKLLPGVIQSNTEIALKALDVSVPNGRLHSQGTLRFVQLPTSTDVSALMQDSDLYFHMELSKPLAQSLIINFIDHEMGLAHNDIDPNSVLGQLAQLGLLRENNDAYNLEIQIKQGVPYVNQQPFNPAVLQQLQRPLLPPVPPQEVLTPPPAKVPAVNGATATPPIIPAPAATSAPAKK